MMTTLAHRLHDLREIVWERRTPTGRALWWALQPATGLFATAVWVRDLGFRSGILRAERAAIPVVSVGNLTVGGTGKTPMTLWLARRLRAAGYQVGIVLRGYSGKARVATVVSRGSGLEAHVDDVGDEAAMLARCFGGIVVTARQRIEGVTLAHRLGADIAILDDGFQHRWLARDFDLVLVSSRRGGLLPTGPMREPWSALRRAHAVALAIRGEEESALPLPPEAAAYDRPQLRVRFRPNAIVASVSGTWQELPISTISGARVTVVSAIAEPSAFYATVRAWGAQVQEIFEFPDHHRYSSEDWQRVNRNTPNVDLVVTTEKDLIKLERFPFERGKLVAVRVVPEVEHGDSLIDAIEASVRASSV